MSLQDIVEETKISKQILLKLENGDFRFLPQKVFCRNFVAQYAAAVGTDSNRLVDDFECAWDRFLLASGSHPNFVIEEYLLVRSLSWSFWLPVVDAGVNLLAAAVVFWRGSGQVTHIGSGAGTITVAPGTRSSVPAGSRVRKTPTIIAAPVVEPDEVETVTIVVRVKNEMECWIHFRDRNGAAGGKLLGGGSEETIALPGPVKLTIGDAGAASLEVAGRIYEDLGRSGQVGHTEASGDGLVVLGPRARND